MEKSLITIHRTWILSIWFCDPLWTSTNASLNWVFEYYHFQWLGWQWVCTFQSLWRTRLHLCHYFHLISKTKTIINYSTNGGIDEVLIYFLTIKLFVLNHTWNIFEQPFRLLYKFMKFLFWAYATFFIRL